MDERTLFTAKFKRDYIAYAAVVIFFAIVAAEVALAIGIPVFLVNSDLWARQIQRQNMETDYDWLRRAIRRSKIGDENAQQELALVGWGLNMMSRYLREHRHDMPHSQVVVINSEVGQLRTVVGKLEARDKPYNRGLTLKTDDYLRQLADRLAELNRVEQANGEENHAAATGIAEDHR